MTVGIVGLGLIGGSAAKAYKANSDHKVLGFNRNTVISEYALLSGAIDEVLDDNNIGECDFIILSLYPAASVEFMENKAHLFKKGCLVMDFCGTKRMICKKGFELAEKHGFTFVGGHPMAGTQYSGLKNAKATMFKGASIILVPPKFDDIALLEKVKRYLEPLDFGKLNVTHADYHDAEIAFTSQLCHVVSNAFVKSPSAQLHKGYSAGSYRDLTRVAWLNEKMWTELFLENGDNLLKELDIIINSLNEYRDALAAEDAEKLEELLRQGRICKERADG
jgi:prephenate dehydrogenase